VTYPRHYRCPGGGGNGESAGCCVGGGNAEEAGGSVAVPPRGGTVFAAVLVLETDPCGLRLWTGLGGGGTACSTTCTGLGSSDGGGFSQKLWSGGSPVLTWMVCGMYPILATVTACGSEGTASAQGVRHVWPCVVRTSAPGGSDSKRKDCICAEGGVDDIQPGIQSGIAGIEEQPASATPMTAAVAATTSLTPDMTLSVPQHMERKPADRPGKARKAQPAGSRAGLLADRGSESELRSRRDLLLKLK
jgi:hypothetical protein